MRIYYCAPDWNIASGGVKQLYRHVDILNSSGIEAYVLHRKKGFRATWFVNETPIAYTSSSIFDLFTPYFTSLWPRSMVLPFGKVQLGSTLYLAEKTVTLQKDDIVVLPEYFGKDLVHLLSGVQKVIFNQNAHYTFHSYSLHQKYIDTVYTCKEVLGALVVSEKNKDYLSYAFPDLPIHRVINGIDISLFRPDTHKEKLIAYMPRKLHEDVRQVLCLLKIRGIGDWEFFEIDNMSESEVAAALNKASIFLSFSSQEGIGLPPLEAGASGCILVGYAGDAGEEYFLPQMCYPIPQGDVVCFAKTVEMIIQNFDQQKAKELMRFVQTHYSLENEKNSVLKAWNSILTRIYIK